jgi:LacI family transcriptional regulator
MLVAISTQSGRVALPSSRSVGRSIVEGAMASLKEVARLANVDASTASRVLRGDTRQAVRPETRERILRAAAELGYRPNASARSLRTRRSDTIALIVPDIDNVAFHAVIAGVETRAAELGYLVFLVDSRAIRDNEEDVYGRLIAEGRVDGLLIAYARMTDPLASQLQRRHVPVVFVNRRAEQAPASVVVDDAEGSAQAVEYLIGLGHRRIGFVAGAAGTDTARRREEGVRRALARHGLAFESRWVAEGRYTEAGGREAMTRILANGGERPTAFYVANLLSALGALAVLRERGLRVPDDVSVVAMDEHVIANHTQPPLTTVAMPLGRMGEESVQLLHRIIQHEPPDHIVIPDPPQLVIRASTAPPPTA